MKENHTIILLLKALKNDLMQDNPGGICAVIEYSSI